MDRYSRRQVLKAGGQLLPLPFLASITAFGSASEAVAHPLVVVRVANGVAQADGAEPERFWPRETGPISTESLSGVDADRVVSTLARHADRLLLVRNTAFPFRTTGELHAGGGNQLLTAARVGPTDGGWLTLALGESVDNWIAARHLVNGGEPLTLYAGRRLGNGEEVLSYRGPLLLRSAEDDPWAVYQRLLGSTSNGLRHSIHDLVIDQIASIEAHPRLSSDDRRRLELHLDSVRDLEVLACQLSEERAQAMADLAGLTTQDQFRMDIARAHCDLIAIVMACDHASVATLQIGSRADQTRYEVEGVLMPAFHTLSHREVPLDSLGHFTSMDEAHAAINRLHIDVFGTLLDRLEENGVLDRAVAVFVSDVATGSHRYDQIPWVIAGPGDGTLRQGQYVDAGGVMHNRLLNTLLTATGHRKPDGDPIDDFGDPILVGGLVDEMLA